MKLLFYFLTALSLLAAADPIIPTTRRIDWQPGVTFNGGIPARATIYTNLTAIDNTGVDSVSAAIQTAIDNCTAEQTVLLPAGTFRLTSQLVMSSTKTLRGAGMGRTTLVVDYVGGDIGNIKFGVDSFPSTVKNIAGDYTNGTTTVEVNNTTDYSVGVYLIIDQLNNTNYVSNVGYGGGSGCSDCDRESGARVEWQLVKVTGLPDSTHITFSPPLMFPLTNTLTPQTAYVPNWVSRAGIEDFTITNKSGTAVATIHVGQAYQCWIKNVETINAYRKHIWFVRALQCEIRGGYLHGATDFTSNSGYGVEMDGSTACLAEDNIFYELTLPLVTAKGGGGHVVGYNLFDPFRKDGVDGLSASIFNNHGPHVTMCLFEGNVMQKFNSDFDFGSTDYGTLFRNQITAYTTNYPYNKKAIDIRKYNYNFNIVGNVLGNAAQAANGAIYECENDSCTWAQEAIYKLGYTSDGDDSGTGNDSVTATSLMRSNNWNWVNQAAPDSIGVTMTNSFYLDSRPAWFTNMGGTLLQWPPIGSDLSPMVNLIPAQARYENIGAVSPVSRITIGNIKRQ